MSATQFFRKYLDIIKEANDAPTGVRSGSSADMQDKMGRSVAAKNPVYVDGQANPNVAVAEATAPATVNPNVNPNITKQVAATQNAQQQQQRGSADQLAAAQERGQVVQGMQKAGIDKKTVDMYAKDDIAGLSNQAAAAIQTLPGKADLQRIGKEAMGSKEFSRLPKAQQDELRASYAQVDTMPDDYREKGSASLKQVGNIGAQDQADKKAGKGFYAPSAQVQSRVEPKYTEKEVQQQTVNKYHPGGAAGQSIAKTVAAAPISPTASAQQTTNLQVQKDQYGREKAGGALEKAPMPAPAPVAAPKPVAPAPVAAPKPVAPETTTTAAPKQPTPPEPVSEETNELDQIKTLVKRISKCGS